MSTSTVAVATRMPSVFKTLKICGNSHLMSKRNSKQKLTQHYCFNDIKYFSIFLFKVRNEFQMKNQCLFMCYTKNLTMDAKCRKTHIFKPVFQEKGNENQNFNSNIFWPKPIAN